MNECLMVSLASSWKDFPVPSIRKGIKAEYGSVTKLRRQGSQFREDERDRIFRAEYQREGS